MAIVGRPCSLDPVPVTPFDNAPYAIAGISVDWKETATEHEFKADLPGLRKDVVRVEVDEYRMLTISGLCKREVQKTDTWHRAERSSGHFLRRFRLPENVNLDAITANVASGVLTVVVPKVEKKTLQLRSIAITGQEATTPAISHDDKKPVEAADVPVSIATAKQEAISQDDIKAAESFYNDALMSTYFPTMRAITQDDNKACVVNL